MALQAGRAGVRKDQVDYLGKVKGGGGSSDTYTKQQIDTKLSSKQDADKIGGFEFRDNEGTPQYRTSSTGDWLNFSSGGGVGVILDNATTEGITTDGCEIVEGGYQKVENIVYVNMTIKLTSVKFSGDNLLSGMPSNSWANYDATLASNVTVGSNRIFATIPKNNSSNMKMLGTRLEVGTEIQFVGAYSHF